MVHFGNQAEFFAEILAVWHLGGCVIPVDGRLTPFEVGKLAAAANARFSVIADSTVPATLADLAGATTLHTSELGHADHSHAQYSTGTITECILTAAPPVPGAKY